MLEIGMHGVIKNFGFKNVLSGVDMEIMTGDRVGLVGRNGTGKSTILRIIAGEETANEGVVAVRRGASIGYLEQIPRLMERDATTREAMMAPFAQLSQIERRMRALEADMAAQADHDALDRVMRQYAHQQGLFESLDGYAVEERFARVATGFGLQDILDRPFNVLSGGQKTVVMLACTILREPDILLLDEPTNHLDVRTLEWFEGTLAKYRGTVVIVSHDRYFLDKVATKTVYLEAGECTEYHGNYTFSIQERERQLLVEFAQYKNQQKKIEAMKAAIKRYRDWGAQSENEKFFRKAKELEKRLEKLDIMERPQLEKPRLPLAFSGGRSSREVLRLKDFALSIGGLRLLEDVTLTLRFGQRACLLGDNGTGKTTLIRAILGDLAGERGAAEVAPNAKIGYIPQEIRFADDTLTVVDAFRAEYPCPEGQARGILARYFFLGEHVFKRVAGLSGGEKVLLKLAVLVQRQINFLVLDEPTNHIDIETREMLEEALTEFSGTILFVSHDRYFIAKIADRIWAIEDRRLNGYEGDYDTYRNMWKREG